MKVIGLYSLSAHVLMLGTYLLESELKFVEQKGPGNAKGFGQVEDATYLDNQRYLNLEDNQELKNKCLAACFYDGYPPPNALIYNIRWCIIMSRIKYWMQPEKLPDWEDAHGMALYYGKYYNTIYGKSSYDKTLNAFKNVINRFQNKNH